jgi:NAD(P)-dependent dehydrogenase (short-subunit alcohol dehydrogenase family)
MAHYGGAKAALDTYGKAPASELAPARIRVTTIIPGKVRSPGADPIRQNLAAEIGISLADVTAGIPTRRDRREVVRCAAMATSGRPPRPGGSG